MDRGMEMGQDGEPSGAAPLRDASRLEEDDDGDALFQAIKDKMRQTAPERIFLNVGPTDSFDEPTDFSEADSQEVTWAKDEIDSFDVEYVRADLARSAPEAASAEGSPSHPSSPSQDSQEVREAIEAAEAWLRASWFDSDDMNRESAALASKLQGALDLLSQSPKGAAGARELRRAATEIIASPSFLEPGTNPPILTVSVAQVSMDRLRACLQTVPQEDAEKTVAECAFDLIRAMQRIRYNHCNINGLVAEYKECPTPICPDCQRGWGIHYATCSKAGGDGPSAPKTGLRGAAAPGDVVPPDYDKDRDPMGYFNA